MLGILGGMGPMATVDLMRKIIASTPAERDQDHIPVVVVSDPAVPDRWGPVFDPAKPSPLPKMIEGIRRLEDAGATLIVVCCNTAHHWLAELVDATSLPILDIAEAACIAVERRVPKGSAVGVLATEATLLSGFYQRKLSRRGFRCLVPEAQETRDLVMPCIEGVKLGMYTLAPDLLQRSADLLAARGAHAVVLACTELPLAAGAGRPAGAFYIDVNQALADMAIDWYRNRRAPQWNSVAASTMELRPGTICSDVGFTGRQKRTPRASAASLPRVGVLMDERPFELGDAGEHG